MISPVLPLRDSIHDYNRRKISSKKALYHQLYINFCQAQLLLLDSRPCDKEWYHQQRQYLLAGTFPPGFHSQPIPIPPSPCNLPFPSIGYGKAQGFERTMQDRVTMGEICIPCGRKIARIVYAILLDGDKGFECAQFLENRIPLYLQVKLSKLPDLKEQSSIDHTIVNALQLLGPRLNQSYARYRWRREITSSTTSTALICLFHGRTLYTANIGDSRAIFVSTKKTVVLSEDADPRLPRYRKGVEKRGGCVVQDATKTWVVQHPRLVDSPTVARTIGYPEAHSGINPRATVTKMILRERGHLVLASKGLWSALSCKQVASWIQSTLAEKPKQSSQVLAAELIRLACRVKNIYNNSVLIIECSPLSSRAHPSSAISFLSFGLSV